MRKLIICLDITEPSKDSKLYSVSSAEYPDIKVQAPSENGAVSMFLALLAGQVETAGVVEPVSSALN